MSSCRLAVVAAALVALPASARADWRSFTRTYEYQTMPKQGIELETYYTQKTEEFDRDAATASEFQVELEYGVTDHFDLALYQAFEDAGMGLDFTKTKVRGRYRFAERGELPVDTLLYLELIKPDGESAVAFEPKVVLARDFGRFTAAVNLIAEVEVALKRDVNGDEETEIALEEFGWASGITYLAGPTWRIGAEVWGTFEEEVNAMGEEELELGLYSGPTLSWGPSPKFWLAADVGFGVTEASNAYDVRAIIGIGLD